MQRVYCTNSPGLPYLTYPAQSSYSYTRSSYSYTYFKGSQESSLARHTIHSSVVSTTFIEVIEKLSAILEKQ